MPDTALVVQGGSFLEVLNRIASDPSVDVAKMQAIMEMCERQRAQIAEVAFSEAMGHAQSEMIPVTRDAVNEHSRSRYARLETIDAKLRPIYTKHGFSLTFNSGEPKKAGAVRIICDVLHQAGHSRRYELEGDLDVAGSQGKSNKTSIQGLGSSVSYLRRYLTLMIFNLQLTNEDDDGLGGGSREAQAEVAKRKIAEMSGNDEPPPPTEPPPPPPKSDLDFKVLQGFAEIKKIIGKEQYYRILGANGYSKSSEIPDRVKGRAIYKEMAEVAKAIKAQQEPPNG